MSQISDMLDNDEGSREGGVSLETSLGSDLLRHGVTDGMQSTKHPTDGSVLWKLPSISVTSFSSVKSNGSKKSRSPQYGRESVSVASGGSAGSK